MEKSVTVQQVLDWKPCGDYNHWYVTRLFDGHERLTVADIAKLAISVRDRMWAILHPELLTRTQMRILCCDFAERVIYICNDEKFDAVVDAARGWIYRHDTNEDLELAIRIANDVLKDQRQHRGTLKTDAYHTVMWLGKITSVNIGNTLRYIAWTATWSKYEAGECDLHTERLWQLGHVVGIASE